MFDQNTNLFLNQLAEKKQLESGIWMDGYNYQNITTITTILVLCKCNRQHRRLDIATTNMNSGLAQVYQTCMLVGASLTDMTAGEAQLRKTWQMVGCNCYSYD